MIGVDIMNSINVLSGSGIIFGKKIRFINYNNINYFIYSLNEIDEEGYEKVYVNKVVNYEEYLINDYEWDDFKSAIPQIVKQIKSKNISLFIDLSLNEMDEVNLMNSRVFKLKSTIVDSILKEEKYYENLENTSRYDLSAITNQESSLSTNVSMPMKPIDSYNSEIEMLKIENEQLKQKIEELEQKLNSIKDLIK